MIQDWIKNSFAVQIKTDIQQETLTERTERHPFFCKFYIRMHIF
jgi:hypothetical protein